MADDYLARAVAAALAQATGDRTAAQRLLLRRAAGDGRLLKALVGPFMPGIVARAVERHATAVPPRAAARPARQRPLGAADLDAVIGRLGDTIGRAEPGSPAARLLGREPRHKAGPGHEQALRTICKAFARKRLEGEAV